MDPNIELIILKKGVSKSKTYSVEMPI